MSIFLSSKSSLILNIIENNSSAANVKNYERFDLYKAIDWIKY
jgi:hypothetical protein